MKKILSLPPLSHIVTMFREETWDSLRDEFDVYENDSPGQMTAAAVHELIGERDAILHAVLERHSARDERGLGARRCVGAPLVVARRGRVSRPVWEGMIL
jgi:hypothetical protein